MFESESIVSKFVTKTELDFSERYNNYESYIVTVVTVVVKLKVIVLYRCIPPETMCLNRMESNWQRYHKAVSLYAKP